MMDISGFLVRRVACPGVNGFIVFMEGALMIKGGVALGRLTCHHTVDAGGWAVACDGAMVGGIHALDVVVLRTVVLPAEQANGGALLHFTVGRLVSKGMAPRTLLNQRWCD
jgi:hypothetical protein